MASPFYSPPVTWQDDTQFTSMQLNANFTDVYNDLNSLQTQINNLSTQGTATSGMFNAANPIYAGGMSPTAPATQNVAAFAAAVNAALANPGGGTVFIPAGSYAWQGTVTISNTVNTTALIIAGSSGGTQLLSSTPGNDIINVSSFAGGAVGGGLRFRNLWFQYASNANTGTGIALHISGASQCVTADECIFHNCPQGFQTDPNDGLQCGVINSLLVQEKFSSPNVGQFDIGGTQNFVDNCLLRQTPIASSGPRNNVGIYTHGGNSCRLGNIQISDFDYGVFIGGGSTQRIWLNNAQIESWTTGLWIQPQDNSHTIYGVFVGSSWIKQTQLSTSQTVGVYIDTNGGANTNVEGIFFTNTAIIGWAASGIQVNSARSLNVCGGMISSNGLNPPSTLLGCGASFTNGTQQPSGMHFVGVDFVGTFDFVGGVQPYAIGATGASSVRCWACTMTGQGTGVVFTTAIIGTPDIKLYDCTGYSDTAPLVSSGSVTSGTPTTLANLGWFSKGVVYVSGGSGVTLAINGHALTGLTSGPMVIPDARVQFTITWSSAPTITVIGG